MYFLQDQIYNNLLNELKTEGAFLITEETEDNKSAEPQES